jgi:hypothetical protein
MEDYTRIFNLYNTAENINFLMLNKRIEFPSDKTLFIYDKLLVNDNIPWTVLSYKLYGNMNYWWVLSSLNNGIFYAVEGETITYIKKDYLDDILGAISTI